MRIFGPSNEKYHVRGGNDQIPERLAQALAPRIRLGQRLTAIRRMHNNTYRLTFGSGGSSSGGSSSGVTAGLVVLTGSYSYWRVGQYTKFAGVEGEPEGNCHFAGEHTSIGFQGYMNGAVESGFRAAAEIAAKVRN